MHPFWEHTIAPLLDAAEAQTIVEIGAEQGRTTGLLLARARRVGGTVHAVDPVPRFDVSKAELEHGQSFRFHRARGVDVLGRLSGLDAALIDGDHNWHSVHSELTLLAQRGDAEGNPLPLIIAHDVGWPYGRRDMYYDPKLLPDSARQNAARSGMVPGRSELDPAGVNPGYWNATHEGGPRNGVLTAIEDFVEERREDCELIVVPGWHGLAVIAARSRLERSPKLVTAIRGLRTPEYLRAQLERIERARIVTGMRRREPNGAGPAGGERARRDYGLLDEPG